MVEEAQTPPATEVASPVEVLAAEAESDETTYDNLSVRDKQFRLAPKIPAMVLLRLSAAADPKTSVPAQMGAILSFLERIVLPDDRSEFLDYLESAEPVIEFEELNNILTEATEIISNRPTSP